MAEKEKKKEEMEKEKEKEREKEEVFKICWLNLMKTLSLSDT